MKKHLIVTCEHAGSKVPAVYRYLFKDNPGILKSHRGFDIGALRIAKYSASICKAPLYYNEITRLLADANRSPHNRALFSEFTRCLIAENKKEILARYYYPHREAVENAIKDKIASGVVVHIAVHSFTPRLNGKIRNADIGILYDQARSAEKSFAAMLRKNILQINKNIRVRFNYPYKGTSDGLAAYLRKKFNERYIGIELEINQKLLFKPNSNLDKMLATALTGKIDWENK